MKNLKKELDKYESIIFANEELFKKSFCDEETMDLEAVYFNTESMKINYVLLSGQHISDSVKLEKFQEWLDYYELL